MITSQVLETIKKHSLIVPGDHLLIGLSGGPDSTCLAHVMHMLKNNLRIRISAIYINHGLRPDELKMRCHSVKNSVMVLICLLRPHQLI
jgi:tRNA(Ile)-lysidine synthase